MTETCHCVGDRELQECSTEGCGNMGEHVFGPIEIPTGDGEYAPKDYVEGEDYPCDDGDCTLDSLCLACRIREVGVVEWTGEYEEIEIWECQQCFEGENDDRED